MFFLEEVDTWQWVERSSLEHPWFFSYLCQFFTRVTLFFYVCIGCVVIKRKLGFALER
jgi:hypothetical protein